MKVSINSALLLVLVCQPTSSEPGLAALAAFKTGLVAGILKGLKIGPSRSPQNSQLYQGKASGNLTFAGSLTRNGNQYSNSGYGHPYWNSGQLKLSGNVNYSGQRRPIPATESRIRQLSGNVAFNGNLLPVTPVTNVPVVTFASAPDQTFSTESIAATDAPVFGASISSGLSAADVNVLRSNNKLPYGYGNVNINVANAGSGVGAVINLNSDGTNLSPPESSAAAQIDSSISDGFSSFSSISDDTFVSQDDDTYSDIASEINSPLSTDSFGNYDSFSSVNEIGNAADNEIVPLTDFDFTDPATDFSEDDFATNFEENIDSVIATDFGFDSTTKPPSGLNFEFNASGSGSIRKGNGIQGSGNFAVDSSISASGVTETPVGSTDYFTDVDISESDFTSDFASDFDGGFLSDNTTASTADFSSDFDSDFGTPSTSDFNSDFSSDFSPDSNSYGFNGDALSDFSTDFIDTSVLETSEPLNTNNEFEINTSGYVSGTTDDNLEPSVAVSGSNTEHYDRYIQSNVDAIRALSDIAKTHGSGAPVSIRLRTAHRVRNPTRSSSQSTSALSSTAGGGLLGIFSDGSRYKVSQAPLLYKYSDIIESPDAVPSRQYHLSASALGNVNVNFAEGRSITGDRMPMARRPTTLGKSLPNRSNSANTSAQNVRRASLVNASSLRNTNRAPNNPNSRQTAKVHQVPVSLITRSNIPQISTAINTRTPTASNRPKAGVPNLNSNSNHDAKSIASSRRSQNRTNPASGSEFSFIGVLAQFAEAHRQSLLKTASPLQNSRSPSVHTSTSLRSNNRARIARHALINENSAKAIANVAKQQQQSDPVSSSPITRASYRGMLYETNTLENEQFSSSTTQLQTRLRSPNSLLKSQTRGYVRNQNPLLVQQMQNINEIQSPIVPANLPQANVLSGRGNLGIPTLPSDQEKKEIVSSLDRKENSGITRARLRYRHSGVIPSSRL